MTKKLDYFGGPGDMFFLFIHNTRNIRNIITLNLSL